MLQALLFAVLFPSSVSVEVYPCGAYLFFLFAVARARSTVLSGSWFCMFAPRPLRKPCLPKKLESCVNRRVCFPPPPPAWCRKRFGQRQAAQSVKRRNVTDARETCEQKGKSGRGELALSPVLLGTDWVHGSLEHACLAGAQEPQWLWLQCISATILLFGYCFLQLNHKVHEQICADEFCKFVAIFVVVWGGTRIIN